MNAKSASFPVKTREIHNNHMDSTIWNEFKFRPDDIIIGTYAKSGTTWMQQIVSQLIFDGEEGLSVSEMSPWIDMRIPPRDVKLAAVEAQTHRRFLKTHLPVDAFVFRPDVKHLYLARDGRDVIWSMHHHHLSFIPEFYPLLNNFPGLVGAPLEPPVEDAREYFLDWLDRDGFPVWSFWENIRSWWAIRDLPNVMLIHFNDLKADLEGSIRRIADFLEISPSAEKWPAIVEHSTFDYMRANADAITPGGGLFFEGGGKTFINKGVNGRWQGALTAEDNARYEARALAEFGPDCARWVKEGGWV
ncbi:MAG: sulfotransferase domain-containing protein [Parvularculaceae bacterium]